ncbi:MAG: sulfatase-like hydrolase/transferase [Anaerolineales bacterium]|nr:sulfatase-like hydrolase/transferase [Anaerolineales bacterium]
MVLFTSDRGEWLGEHLRFGKGYPGDDAISRTPLIVRWPGEIAATGRTVSQIVEAVDIVPTLWMPRESSFRLTCKGRACCQHCNIDLLENLPPSWSSPGGKICARPTSATWFTLTAANCCGTCASIRASTAM